MPVISAILADWPHLPTSYSSLFYSQLPKKTFRQNIHFLTALIMLAFLFHVHLLWKDSLLSHKIHFIFLLKKRYNFVISME